MTEMATGTNDQGSSSSKSENGTVGNINILLLGETGVGKSTFINAFANYLTFEKMPNGDNDDLVSLIPTSFTMCDHNDEVRRISIGKETKDEAFEVGNAATRSPSCYEFPLGDVTVRIIDTPGIGDPRGIEQDKVNFENIITFLSIYEYLHCICILLKPNNTRLTIIFDFCIKQLLCHLQKDASKNIVFLYTNSRGNFYKPGETEPILKQMLKSIEDSPPHVKITYNPSTRYFLDNESFRFLMAVKCGVTFDEDTIREFSMSWDKSVKECQRLMKYIIGYPEENIPPLPPHRIKDTVSLNMARRMILELSRPLADIMNNISLNLEVLQKKKKEIEENSSDIESLKVCSAVGCQEVKDINGVKRCVPKKVCCANCLTSGYIDIIGPVVLYFCHAMNWDGTCRVCGCTFQLHMHLNYKVKESIRKIDDTVQTKMNAKVKDSEKIQEFLQRCQEVIDEYNEEKVFVTKAMAEFACFLRDNAIIGYNDTFKKYLEYSITNLETLNEKGVDNKTIIDGLRQMIKDYEAQITQIEKAMKSAKAKIWDEASCPELSADYILKKIEQLKDLKFSGKAIAAMQKAQQDGMKGLSVHRVTTVKTTDKGNFISNLWRKIFK